MVQVGGQEDFIFTDETTYGDGGDFTTSKRRIGQNPKLLNPNFSQSYRLTYGGAMKPQKKVVGEKDYRFYLEFAVDSWQFMKYLTNVSTETGSDPYTHTLTIPTEDFSGSSFAFQRIFDSSTAYLHKGVKPVEMSIKFQKGQGEQGFLIVTLNCICQDIEKVDVVNIETLAESSRDLFHFYNARLTTTGNEIVEVNSGTYSFSWGVNNQDTRYANATLSTLIGEPIYTNLSESIQLSINTLNANKMDEFLARTELSGSNQLEFYYNDNNKITFDFEHLYNEGNLPPTQYGEITKTDIVYTPIINNITVIDDIQNY